MPTYTPFIGEKEMRDPDTDYSALRNYMVVRSRAATSDKEFDQTTIDDWKKDINVHLSRFYERHSGDPTITPLKSSLRELKKGQLTILERKLLQVNGRKKK